MNFTLGTVTFSETDSSAPGRRVWGVLPATLPSGYSCDPSSGTLEIAHTKGSNNKPDRHMIKMGINCVNNDGVVFPITVHAVFTLPTIAGTIPGSIRDDVLLSSVGLRDLLVNILSDTEYTFMDNFLSGFYEGVAVGP